MSPPSYEWFPLDAQAEDPQTPCLALEPKRIGIGEPLETVRPPGKKLYLPWHQTRELQFKYFFLIISNFLGRIYRRNFTYSSTQAMNASRFQLTYKVWACLNPEVLDLLRIGK